MTFTARLLSRRARGVAMFEVVCALALIAVVIVGAVLLYQSVTASNARAELVQLSRELRGGVERAWVGMGTYSGLSLTALCKYGAVPETAMRTPGNCGGPFETPLGDPDGGSDTIGLWQLGPKRFQLAFQGIPGDACAALLNGYVGQTDTRSNFLGAVVRHTFTSGWGARSWGDFVAAAGSPGPPPERP